MHDLSLKTTFGLTHMILEKIMRGFIFALLSLFVFLSSAWFETKTSQAQEIGTAQRQHLAEQGNAEAQYDLGMAYIKGQNVQQNYQAAKEWLEKSATQDYPDALSFLGFMYQNGLGVEKNYAKALDFLNRAASKGDTDAMASLGQMYSDGEGVERNYSKALEYLKPAANAGNWGAQYTLGAMYADGRGVPQDYVEAHKWFNILAATGFKQVIEVRNRLAKKMTPDQIAQAQQLAREWKPVFKPDFTPDPQKQLQETQKQKLLDEAFLALKELPREPKPTPLETMGDVASDIGQGATIIGKYVLDKVSKAGRSTNETTKTPSQKEINFGWTLIDTMIVMWGIGLTPPLLIR